MRPATEVAGYIGVGLAAAAYVPQITHLIHARCSAGISRLAFGVWLTSSLLIASRAVAIRATIFVVLGVVQIVATAIICIYAKIYESSFCELHAPRTLMPRRPTAGVGLRG
jgi:hypothetical protein